MKNKNIIIAVIVVILLLLLGTGGYLMMNKSAGNSSKSVTQTMPKPTQSQQPTTKSLIDLVRMGQNLRCNFKTEVTNGSTEGTIYVSGQNIRADFNITSSGKTMQTSMIKNADTSYIWGDSIPGIKMTLSLDQISQSEQTSRYFNASQKINYSCTPWNVDSSLFVVPTNVKFTDMTNLMAPKVTGTQVQPNTQTKPAIDPCAQITNETDKAACENALKQNGQ